MRATARRALVHDATRRLEAAGVHGASGDAEVLLAHVLGVPRGRLVLVEEVDDGEVLRYEALVVRRAEREPLQHLTGQAGFRTVELQVGPGVFVPRPETELLAGWALEQLSRLEAPVVVDLGTGSGAIAKALAVEEPRARVHAVELLAVRVPDYAYVQVPLVAAVVGLVAALVGIRRVNRIDPAAAFAGAGA